MRRHLPAPNTSGVFSGPIRPYNARPGRMDTAMQKALIAIGLVLVAVGLLWPWLGRLPFGRLPGDIIVERDNYSFFFPLTTMIVISLIVSLVLWLLRK